ncbi:MAG: potassium channel family protein [Chloroflexi bacterium]|nr:potassium channel family protein [Chloroflexota bacterium]MYB84472.1 potassium channel family protein [Chloroflexota bacterium]
MHIRETLAHVFETQLARSLLALAVLVGMATAGYMLIEGWSLLDAAYMTVVTFTTVGYEEVHPLSSTGRVFTMFLMVAGVGVMLYILTSVMHLIVAQEVLRNLVRRRRMRARMAKLNGHFIVCGFGRVGRAVALTLQEQSAELIVVDKDANALAEAEERSMLWVHGDSAQDENLLAAHIKDARGLVAATGDDSQNVYVSLTARGLNPELYIVARASRPDAEEKLRRAGADAVVLPHVIGGKEMALSAMASSRQE